MSCKIFAINIFDNSRTPWNAAEVAPLCELRLYAAASWRRLGVNLLHSLSPSDSLSLSLCFARSAFGRTLFGVRTRRRDLNRDQPIKG